MLKAKFLFTYLMTPHDSTGHALAELLLGCQPRSVLDLLYPNTQLQIPINQEPQKIRLNQCMDGSLATAREQCSTGPQPWVLQQQIVQRKDFQMGSSTQLPSV